MSNPFELRFNLLEMAQGYLKDQEIRNNNFFRQAWDLALENGTANMELWNDLQPKSFSVEDVKKMAAELYEFVEKR